MAEKTPETLKDFTAGQITKPALPQGAEQVYQPLETKPDEFMDPDYFSKNTQGPTQRGAYTVDPKQTADINVPKYQETIGGILGSEGSKYNAAQVDYQEGTLPEEATARYQLEQLMADVKANDAPWADGAIRAANAAMMRRGLGQSSMAAAAISQSILEAALPIAQFDAKQFGDVNLLNMRQRHETLLTNQAAENAARQFNATSQLEVDKFMAGLTDQVIRYNAEVKNRMAQFNAEQMNSVYLARDQMDLQHKQWIAENNALVQRSNVEWRRSQNLANTAGVNATNMLNTMNRFNMSQQALADLWQRTRDVFNWANISSENEADRAFKTTLYSMQRGDFLSDRNYNERASLAQGVGSLAFKLAEDVGERAISEGLDYLFE